MRDHHVNGQTYTGRPAADWLANAAPEGFGEFIRRLTWHHDVRWDAPDYIEDSEFGEGGDGRRVTDDLEQVEAFSSDLGAVIPGFDETHQHALVLDVDVPAWLIPSSTPGHSHLYVQVDVPEADLWEFLDAAVKVGLVEEGYVRGCKSRGMTSVRAPWVTKGREPSTLRRRTEPQTAEEAL